MNPMGLLLHFSLISLTCVPYGIASEFRNWPAIVFKKGETASLPCLPRGDANAYFWRKGIWFNVSENIASIVHGIADNSEKFEVLPNGSLNINDLSINDEGTYYCRIASEVNECHGQVTIYLEVTSDELDLSIEECKSQPVCTMDVVPLSEITLTCTVNFVSDSMTLKWYNGPNELSREVLVLKDSENKLSSTIRLKFTTPTILTCEAVGIALSRSITHIHLDKTNETTETPSPQVMIWIIPIAILSVICIGLVLFLIFSHKAACKGKCCAGKQDEKTQGEEQNLMQENNDNLKKKVGELEGENDELRKTKGVLERENDDLKKTKGVLERENDDLKKTKGVLERENDDLRKTKGVLEVEHDNLKKKVRVLEGKNKQLNEPSQDLKSDSRSLKKEVQPSQTCRAITCCLDPSKRKTKIKKINYMIGYNNILNVILSDNAGKSSEIFQNILQGRNSCVFICGISFYGQGVSGSFDGTVQEFYKCLKKLLPSCNFQVSITDIERVSKGNYVFENPARVGKQERTITVDKDKAIPIKNFYVKSLDELRTIALMRPLSTFDKDHYGVVTFYTEDKGNLSISFIDDFHRIQNCMEDKIDDSFDNFLQQVTQLRNSVITLIINCDIKGERDKLVTELESRMNYLSSIHSEIKG